MTARKMLPQSFQNQSDIDENKHAYNNANPSEREQSTPFLSRFFVTLVGNKPPERNYNHKPRKDP